MIVRSNYRLQRRVQRPCMLELFYDCTTWKHLHDTNVTTCISFKLTKTTGVHSSFTLTEWIQMIFEPFSEGFGGLLQIRLHPICILLAQNWPVWSWPRVSLGNWVCTRAAICIAWPWDSWLVWGLMFDLLHCSSKPLEKTICHYYWYYHPITSSDI